MRELSPIPEDLIYRPFANAAAAAVGVPSAQVSGPLWPAAAHGVHIWHGVDESNPWVRIQVVAAALPPDAVISGWAAAYLHGVTWLDGVRPGQPEDVLLDVLVLRGFQHTPLRRRGIRTRRGNLRPGDITFIDGICVSSPLRTAFELLRVPPLAEAVASVDAMLHSGLVTVGDLAAYVEGRPRWRGVPLARRALTLLDGGAESPMESRLRLIWVLGGLPPPVVNVLLHDTFTGARLGRPDFLDEEAGVAVEFDGAYHRTPEQHRADTAREHLLEQAGLIVVRFDGYDAMITPRRRSR